MKQRIESVLAWMLLIAFTVFCLYVMASSFYKIHLIEQGRNNTIWDKYEKCLDKSMLLPTDLCGCAEEVYLEDHFDGYPDGKPDEATQRQSFERCVRLSDSTDLAICHCASQVGRPDWCY